MVIDLYKRRLPIMIICLFFTCIPLLIKFNHIVSVPHPEKKSPYGKYLKWQEVNNIFPLYTVATVTDLDTGLQFGVQRRGGYYHADVQPLTAADTAVMKKIYMGKWTWKRRAVTVQIDDGFKIAASMNGMPHGQGAIRDNNFNGHFCIHFADSKTHGSKKVDLAHQIMIWKSANIVDKRLKTLSPRETLRIFFAAVNQGDKTISTKIIASQDKACWQVLEQLESIIITSVQDNKNNSYTINLRIKYKDHPSEQKQKIMIKLAKQSSGWKIEPQALLALKFSE